MIFFNLFEVITALIVKIELSSIALVGSVMVAINTWVFAASLVNFVCFTETAKSSFEFFPVDVAESKHVIADDKVLIKFRDFGKRKFGEFN